MFHLTSIEIYKGGGIRMVLDYRLLVLGEKWLKKCVTQGRKEGEFPWEGVSPFPLRGKVYSLSTGYALRRGGQGKG